jgi:hypothetical protein
MWNGLSKIKIYDNHLILKILILKNILEKFQCISLINFSFHDFLKFLILTLFWHFFESTFFIFHLWQMYVIISRVHYESIIFFKFIQKNSNDSH